MKQIKDFQNKHRTEWKDFLWGALIDKIIGVKSRDQAKQILNSLFSNYEKEIATKRIAALILIQDGRGYKEISEILWLSHATISALKKNFFGKSNNYKSQRSLKMTKQTNLPKIKIEKSWLNDLFKDIDIWKLLKNPPRPTGMGLKNYIR